MSASPNTSPNVPLTNADYSLEVIEKNARRSADHVIRGLTTAPKQSPTAACAVLLSFCFHSLAVSIQEIALRRSVSGASIYRSEYGQLLDIAVTFANSTWTRAQKEKYENCRCTRHEMKEVEDFGDTYYKDARGYFQSYGPFHQIVIDVFSIITDTVEDIRTSKSDAIKLERNPKKRSKWPSSPSIFIPKSAPKTVSAFMVWARLIENPIPIHVLSQLTFCCPSLEPAMFANEELLPLTASLFSQFISSIRNLDWKKISTHRKEALTKDVSSFSHIFKGGWFTKLATGADSDKFIPSLTSIYNSLCEILPIIDKIGISEDFRPGFGIMGGLIYRVISQNASLFAPHDVIIPYIQFFKKAQFKPLMLPPYVLLLRNQSKCAHISCVQTTESTRLNFKLCSGCTAVRYCCKECQTGDRKAHKRVCKPLKAILPIAFAQVNSISQLDPSAPTEELSRKLTDQFKELSLTDEDLSE